MLHHFVSRFPAADFGAEMVAAVCSARLSPLADGSPSGYQGKGASLVNPDLPVPGR